MIQRHNTFQSVGAFLAIIGFGAWIRGSYEYTHIGWVGLGMFIVGTLCRVLKR